MKNIFFKHSLELAARIYVFFILHNYGIGKIIGGQFYRKGKLPDDVAIQTLADATAYDLAWTFMGYSQSYIVFIGLSQIIGAWLLLFNKTKFLGAMILIPILLNIIVFDIIFLPDYGALASACIYFTLLVLILVLNKEKLFKLLKLIVTSSTNEAKLRGLKTTVVVIILISILFGIDQAFIYFLDKA